MVDIDAREIWDRALDYVTDGLAEDAGFGDRHLMEALGIDEAINTHGLDQLFEEHDVAEGITAFRWFGLDDVAEFLEDAPSRVGSEVDEEDNDDVSAEYYDLDVVDRLTEALEEKLGTDPEAFLPLG